MGYACCSCLALRARPTGGIGLPAALGPAGLGNRHRPSGSSSAPRCRTRTRPRRGDGTDHPTEPDHRGDGQQHLCDLVFGRAHRPAPGCCSIPGRPLSSGREGGLGITLTWVCTWDDERSRVETPRVGGLIDAAAEGYRASSSSVRRRWRFPKIATMQAGRSAPGIVISKIQPSGAAAAKTTPLSRTPPQAPT